MLNSVTYGSGKSIVNVSLPTVSSVHEVMENGSCIVESAVVENQQTLPAPEEEDFISTSQLMPKLVTLSLLPKAQWQSLVNIDTIKVYLSFS